MTLMWMTVWGVAALYGIAVGSLSHGGDAPLLFRWPAVAWDLIAHSWRRPIVAPPRADQAKIAKLERELGLAESEQGAPIRRKRAVCLTKDCQGETEEVRTWRGDLLLHIHHCQ